MSIAKFIDNTLLKVDASQRAIEDLCSEAVTYETFAVCVNPGWVKTAYQVVKGSGVKVCSVVGFPLGATFDSVILSESELALAHGAEEIDMVMNVGAIKSGEYNRALQTMKMVSELVHGTLSHGIVKVIVESVALTLEEKKLVAALVVDSGADFLKTSTGFIPNPHLVDDVAYFLETLPAGFKIKAAGGIRDYDTAKRFVDMGVSRIGTSSAKIIVEGENQTGH